MDKNIIKLLTILLIIIVTICFISFSGKKTDKSKVSNDNIYNNNINNNNINNINNIININNINNINSNTNNNTNNNINIVTSFYPIYIMTINVTDGVNGVNVSNMSENLKGCIHDYTLSTDDLKKVEKADVFIETGENLEPFSNKIKTIYPNVKIIDSGKNVSNVIKEETDKDEKEKSDIKEDNREDNNEEINPHIWMDTANYNEQVIEIAKQLGEIDLKNKDKYIENAENYNKKIDEISNQFRTLNMNGVKAVSLDEQLEYLLKQNGMDVISIETDHENSALSADVVSKTIQKMKNDNIKAIFIDKDSDDKNAKMLANETGAKIYRLNSAMNGDNSYNSYIKDMEENYEILKQVKE